MIFQTKSQAQEVGLGEVLFDNTTTVQTQQNILINGLSYDIVKLHLTLAGKDIEASEYQKEKLTTIKTLEELTKTDVISLLDLSINKQKTLAKYLADCDQILQKGNVILAYMRQEMLLLK